MYQSIRIEGLRALDNVELNGLRRVNLLVGRNNVGKTTVLEALLLLSAATNPATLVTLGILRGQRMDRTRPDPEPIWRTFAHGFFETRIIKIGGLRLGEPAERVLQIHRLSSQGGGGIDQDLTSARVSGEIQMSGVVFEYTAPDGSTSRASAQIEDGEVRTTAPRYRTDFVRAALVSPRARTLDREAEQYGYLLRNKKEEPVLQALRLLDDRIQRLEIVPEAGASAIYCDLGFPTMVPLAVCGDGVVRLFSFVVELTSVAGGVLLVDEIDAGLHHAIMVPFWQILRRLAEQLDVQIFATTHNDELLRSALLAFEDDLSWLSLHRLDRRKQGIVAVAYDDETLAVARDERFEVRG